MKIQTKFDLDQTVYFLRPNTHYNSPALQALDIKEAKVREIKLHNHVLEPDNPLMIEYTVSYEDNSNHAGRGESTIEEGKISGTKQDLINYWKQQLENIND